MSSSVWVLMRFTGEIYDTNERTTFLWCTLTQLYFKCKHSLAALTEYENTCDFINEIITDMV